MTLGELRARATIERDGYHVFDGEYALMSVTLEDAEFLYGLVRLVRPEVVLEFGTGLGVAARFMAEGLAANEKGRLVTIEPDADLWARAWDTLLDGLPTPVFGPSKTSDLVEPDLVFIDSDYRRREDDIDEWLTNGYQGLVCVHDSKRDYPGLANGAGVFLPGVDGLWLGRAA